MSDKQLIYERAILIARSESHTSIEKKALRNAGFTEVKVYTSGIEVAYALSVVDTENLVRNELIFCQSEFSDIDAFQFIELMRLHPLLYHQPFVAISGSIEEGALLREKGFTSILMRPIDIFAIQKTANLCKRFENERYNELLEEIKNNISQLSPDAFFARLHELTPKKKSLIEETTVESALKEASQFLREGNYEKAIPLFAKASVEEHTAPKAYEALSIIYSQQKNIKLSEKYLREAIKANFNTKDYQRMLDLSYRYKQKFPSLEMPLAEDFNRIIKKQKFIECIEALKVLRPVYPLQESMGLFIDALLAQNSYKELLDEFRLIFKDDTSLASLYDRLLKEKTTKNKKSFFSLKKKEEALVPKENKIEALPISTALLSQNKTESKTAKDDWKNIPRIPKIDEGTSFGYPPLDMKESKSMVWNIIKGTALMYKNMNKEKK